MSVSDASSTVLVVEDDHDLREVLADALEAEGYAVLSARDGREAIDLLRRSSPPCVILLDLMMPGMNGWQFRAEQSRDPSIGDIPVVALSADANVSVKAQHLGVAGHLKKPVSLDALLDVVKSFVRSS